MTTYLRPATSLILLMTLITGAVYPLVVTGVAQVAFPEQANGSLLRDDQGQVRGSLLIAQVFKGDAWFHARPSAADYATVASGASNLAPSNPGAGPTHQRQRFAAVHRSTGRGTAGPADHLRQWPGSAFVACCSGLSIAAGSGCASAQHGGLARSGRAVHPAAIDRSAGGQCTGLERRPRTAGPGFEIRTSSER
ncbi:K+-transporting ATPase KdpC subunit [Pseudomonas sp. 210_17 TE3656]